MRGCRADARSCMRRWKSEGQQGRLGRRKVGYVVGMRRWSRRGGKSSEHIVGVYVLIPEPWRGRFFYQLKPSEVLE